MPFQSQTAYPQRPQPAWLRAVTLFCVLLFGAISTAQAAHVHGQWLPHSSPEITRHAAGLPALSEEACPLCIAMHSALPAHGLAVAATALLTPLLTPAPSVPHVASLWHFELFSRPPPALL